MRKLLFLLLATAAIGIAGAQPRMDFDRAYARADSLLSGLTVEEKLSLVHGHNQFFLNSVPRMGIPYVFFSNASQGIARRKLPDPTMINQLERATAFPCPIMLAATFDPALAAEYARSIGEEGLAGGVNILLGPGLNIYRNSQCGRNFEYFGEDPCLVSALAREYVTGLQSTGVGACLKHFLANNSEFYRRRQNTLIDERALHEIYLPGFQSGIDAGAASVMTSYNRVNGEWTGESYRIITELLRHEMGFRGLVMTDWNSVYDLERLIRSGANVEMPGTTPFDTSAAQLLADGRIAERDLDQMLRPMIATCLAYGLYERTGDARYQPEMLKRKPLHTQVALRTAEQGTVLLSNNGILPLNKSTKSILVTGKFIDKIPSGGGSAAVKGYDRVSLREALTAEFGHGVTFVENPTEEQLRAAAAVIVSTGTLDAEALDRPFALPDKEEQEVLRAVAANPRTVVVVNSGSGVRMTDWADRAAAIVYGWYPGQNGFSAIAGVLSGRINPSGKLPMTIEREFADSPARNTMPEGAQFYEKCTNERLIRLFDVDYAESVLVGYRWYDTQAIEPLWPFGYGLSYTTFALSKPRLSAHTLPAEKPLSVSVCLTNTGSRAGAQVVQLYIAPKHPRIVRPVKELKAFSRVMLAPGERRVVEFHLSQRDFAYWDDRTHGWRTDPGAYEILLGSSSRDIACTLPITVE